jgi:hypothetical protein
VGWRRPEPLPSSEPEDQYHKQKQDYESASDTHRRRSADVTSALALYTSDLLSRAVVADGFGDDQEEQENDQSGHEHAHTDATPEASRIDRTTSCRVPIRIWPPP